MRLSAVFGPAAILASVSIGAGETIVVVQTGSWAGYELLWLVVASVLTKGICVTYLLGRYTAVSGEPIGQRLVRVPGPRGWLLLAIIFLELSAAGPLWAAIARPSGELIHYVLQHALLADGSDTAAFVSHAATWKAIFGTAFILAALAARSRPVVRQSRETADRDLHRTGPRHDRRHAHGSSRLRRRAGRHAPHSATSRAKCPLGLPPPPTISGCSASSRRSATSADR